MEQIIHNLNLENGYRMGPYKITVVYDVNDAVIIADSLQR